MLTSLVSIKSQNIFSHSRIKILEIEYPEMTFFRPHTVRFTACCERSEACDCPTLDCDGQLGTLGEMVETAFEVLCGGWLVAAACDCLVCLFKALVHVHSVSWADTSDPGSLHCNHGLCNF